MVEGIWDRWSTTAGRSLADGSVVLNFGSRSRKKKRGTGKRQGELAFLDSENAPVGGVEGGGCSARGFYSGQGTAARGNGTE